MSRRLEEFIEMNSEQFDSIEPSADLWARIEKHLPPQYDEVKKPETKTFTLGFVLRVAATVIMVMGISFALYLRNVKNQGVNLAAINPVYAKAQMHYTSIIENKRAELKTLAKANPQLYKQFSTEIAKMDTAYKQLNHDLATSPNQERVLHAMINNLQVQMDVLNQQLSVIEQVNEVKKEQNNESKNI